MAEERRLMSAADVEALKSRGIAAFRSGAWAQAEEAFDEALGLCEEAGDRAGVGEMLVNLGVVHVQLKRYEQAEKGLQRALELFRALGRRSEEAQALGNLGTLYERSGRPERAAEHYRTAAGIFGELGEKENQQATLGALTRLQVERRNWLQSLFTYEQMLAAGQKWTWKQRIFRWLFKLVSKLMRW